MASWERLIDECGPLTQTQRELLSSLGMQTDVDDAGSTGDGPATSAVAPQQSDERAWEDDRPEKERPEDDTDEEPAGKPTNTGNEKGTKGAGLSLGDRMILMRKMIKKASAHAAPHDLEMSERRRLRVMDKLKYVGNTGAPPAEKLR